MSQLDPANQVFLVGTTNHIDDIDPRVLRGGRFTEKIEVRAPDDGGYLLLIEKYLGSISLASNLTTSAILARLRGISPADLQAVGEYRQADGDESDGRERCGLAAADFRGFREGS